MHADDSEIALVLMGWGEFLYFGSVLRFLLPILHIETFIMVECDVLRINIDIDALDRGIHYSHL